MCPVFIWTQSNVLRWLTSRQSELGCGKAVGSRFTSLENGQDTGTYFIRSL